MQTIFITAASGNIGSILIPDLLARNDIKLGLLTITASKLAIYKGNPSVTVVEGPLSDPRWVEEQLVGHAVGTPWA
jgi:nucleoside-diphosphate-sugar epimerase